MENLLRNLRLADCVIGIQIEEIEEIKMSDMEKPGEPIRIPVDAKATDNVDALVREYEDKYYGFRSEESDKVKEAASGKARFTPQRVTVIGASVSEEERMWAAIAHGSAILTLVMGVLSAGI